MTPSSKSLAFSVKSLTTSTGWAVAVGAGVAAVVAAGSVAVEPLGCGADWHAASAIAAASAISRAGHPRPIGVMGLPLSTNSRPRGRPRPCAGGTMRSMIAPVEPLFQSLGDVDPAVAELIAAEARRRATTIDLIASESE